MIDLYSWPTPNGQKVSIMLEETGLPYTVHAIDIGRGDQFKPEFLRISPNNKIPAIVDQDGPEGLPYSVFESGAILLYLAEKTGQFLPREPRGRFDAIQWLMFQMGGLGPMLGQAHHFRQYAPEKIGYAINRYTNEAGRLYRVLDRRLAGHEFLAGGLSIADFACYPWIVPHERQGQNLEQFPHLKRWYGALKERPRLRKGFDVLAEKRRPGPMDEEAKRILFGEEQYRAH
jgi:GST-like protein